MTSRAEYRLVLRQDNADERLTKIGHDIGLISDERFSKFENKYKNINKEIERIKSVNIRPTKEVNALLSKYNSTQIDNGVKLADLIKRSELSYEIVEPIDVDRPLLSKEEAEEVNIEIKYEGYIKLQKDQIEKFKSLENKLLPKEIDYEKLEGLRLEARQKLNKFKPNSVGQASRISGISPADISVLLIYLHEKENR